MKKTLTIIMLMLCCVLARAQETNNLPKNEIKLNVLYLLLAYPEIGYEHHINEESSFGIDVAFSLGSSEMDIRFSALPYYRFYFGQKPSSGFFAEGFGRYSIYEEEEDYSGFGNVTYTNESDFALGFAIGGKFVTKKNLTFEIFGGVGRNLFNNNVDDVVPRFGISFGKRF